MEVSNVFKLATRKYTRSLEHNFAYVRRFARANGEINLHLLSIGVLIFCMSNGRAVVTILTQQAPDIFNCGIQFFGSEKISQLQLRSINNL